MRLREKRKDFLAWLESQPQNIRAGDIFNPSTCPFAQFLKQNSNYKNVYAYSTVASIQRVKDICHI